MKVNHQAPVFQADQLLIQATPAQVWAVLTDINRWPVWNPAISRAAIAAAPGTGITFEWTVKGARIRSVLHTVIPHQAFGWSGTTFGGSAIHNWYLIPQAGGTLVQVEESMQGWLVGLFRQKMNTDLARDMRTWLERLKAVSE